MAHSFCQHKQQLCFTHTVHDTLYTSGYKRKTNSALTATFAALSARPAGKLPVRAADEMFGCSAENK